MADEDKIEKHRGWLRKRQRASDLGQSFSATRSSKDINEGIDDEGSSQRKDLYADSPIKLNLRNYRRERHRRNRD